MKSTLAKLVSPALLTPAVVRKALSLLETKRSEAQDAELQALLGGLSL
jgi:hypothetical protein